MDQFLALFCHFSLREISLWKESHFCWKRRGRENLDHGIDAQRGESFKSSLLRGPWGNRRSQGICRMSSAKSEQMKREVTEACLFSEAGYGSS